MNGLYIHIPFCKSKCPYCDFYSYRCKGSEREEYIESLIDEITTLKRCKEFLNIPYSPVDTLYLGGGTPSVLSGEQIERIVRTVRETFSITEDAEITIECNPGSDIESLIPYFKKCGINRASLGMQSAVDSERKILGRNSDKHRILEVTNLLKENGIDNISLDVMLGIPNQTKESLKETLNFVLSCDIKHISAYILKIEDNTYFGTHRDKFTFPNEDEACSLYEFCCEYLEENGFNQYEISNFAKPGFESRHNTKYWQLENYLGIGPGAHSFVDGKRFFFENSTQKFIDGKAPVYDCDGGDSDEYIMLRLRLKSGINLNELVSLYGEKAASKIRKKAPLLKEKGLVNFDGETISLTRKGFLLSNSIICEFI